jgi:phosphoribosylpyrophosphate synthetase
LANGAEQLELGIVSGRVYPEFAEQIAERLDVEPIKTDLKDFGNTEQYARYAESISKDTLRMRLEWLMRVE